MEAYVLIIVDEEALAWVKQQLEAISCVTNVDPVAGIYDLVATLVTTDPHEIGKTINNGIRRIEGVLSAIPLTVLSNQRS